MVPMDVHVRGSYGWRTRDPMMMRYKKKKKKKKRPIGKGKLGGLVRDVKREVSKSKKRQ